LGQLGNVSAGIFSNMPVPVTGLPPAIGIAAGWAVRLAVGADGKAYGWGSDFYGELGDGVTPYFYPPRTQPVAAIGISRAVAASTGTTHTIFIESE
jgi:alpha-tubulin suppressor-like RCC1 family protein